MGTPAEPVSPEVRAEPYWVQSRRPLASLVFILPLLAIYELGILCCGVRPNGADVFMRHVLDAIGFSQHFLLPGLMVAILLGWHYLSHAPWRLSPGIFPAMIVESIVLGLCLRAVAFVQQSIFTLDIGGMMHAVRQAADKTVGFLGAGIYEELLFRLILLSLVAWAFRHAKVSPRKSMIVAALLVSLLFAAAHHVGPYREEFHWFAFTFRTLAGVFFSVVYIYRGFGIAAGSHAAYDIMVGVF
jgi:membrane protease YdiL (CAAX protease family)